MEPAESDCDDNADVALKGTAMEPAGAVLALGMVLALALAVRLAPPDSFSTTTGRRKSMG
jgi:hypothetical protein